jgi:serine phosphatase RsbU (regulator of sigma subunit)
MLAMMLKKILSVACFLLLTTTLTVVAQPYKGDSWETVQEKKTGKVYILHYDRKPFVYVNEKGKVTGVEYDIITEFMSFLQKEKGVKIKVEWIKFDDFHKLYEEVIKSEGGVWGLPSVPLNEINIKEVQTSPVFMPDIEVIISSKNIAVANDKVTLRSSLRHGFPVTIPNSTVEMSLNRIKRAYFAEAKYENVKTEDEIIEHIANNNDKFGYVNLIDYYLADKQGKSLNRQKFFEVKRSNYAFLFPYTSDWTEPFDEFFHEDKYKQLINFIIKKHLGTDVSDILIDVPGEANQKIIDAEETMEKAINNERVMRQEFSAFRWKAYVAGTLLLVVLLILIFQQSSSRRTYSKKINESEEEIAEIKMELNHVTEQARDGITFAKHIQEVLIPSPEQVKAIFPESFVYYKPKEVVSGDFYWVGQSGDEKILGLFDSTGKGVRASFVTQLSANILKAIVQEKITNPADILKEMDRRLSEMIMDAGFEFIEQEGIEAAVCTVNTKDKTIMFAGAHQTIYFFNGDTLQQVKGSRYDIGNVVFKRKEFHASAFNYKEGDVFYLSSDGFYDQLGSQERMKFMLKNFQELLTDIHKLPIQDQYREIDKIFKAWKGTAKQTDDVCVFGVKLV